MKSQKKYAHTSRARVSELAFSPSCEEDRFLRPLIPYRESLAIAGSDE